MNANTIAFAPSLPNAAQGASSTAEFQFNNSLGAKAEFTVPAGVLNKRRFRIVAVGRVTGGTTTNFTAILHAGASLGTDLFSSGAKAMNSVSGSFIVVFEGALDSTADIITGMGYGSVGPTVITPAIAQAASQDPETALVFSISGTFSASNAGNAAYLDEFSLEVL
jgi:hypothetical protein